MVAVGGTIERLNSSCRTLLLIIDFLCSVLSKSEVVKRSLDYLFVPLNFYVRTVLARKYKEEEIQTIFLESSKAPRRAVRALCILNCVILCTRPLTIL